jgi:hypothetical protein
MMPQSPIPPPGHDNQHRLAWLWAEGWRNRLRRAGDVVEKTRWEWKVDDVVLDDATAGVLEAVRAARAIRAAKKSVRWAL